MSPRRKTPAHAVGDPVRIVPPITPTPALEIATTLALAAGVVDLSVYDHVEIYSEASRSYRWEYLLHGWRPNEDGTRSSVYLDPLPALLIRKART